MKVRMETADNVVETREMKVVSSWRGDVAIELGEKIFSFLPGHAVEIWRVILGAKKDAEVPYVRHGLVDSNGVARIWYEVTDGYKWNLGLSDGTRVVMDENEACALAWALKRCVEDTMFQQKADGAQFEFTETKTSTSVWVLSCRRILTGDCAGTKVSYRIGGHEEVYLSRTSAMENVREFIRPLVNEAYSESYWDNCERDVDDILDEIMDKCCEISGDTYWRHDGQTQSFEVKLSEREVKP